jgi:aspartyl-tRNA(Asn)/glutamyl-tRNA(Gln) amidotransferase subunit A
MPIHHLSAGELICAFRRGALTPVEVMEAMLERIAAFEPIIHATCYCIDATAARRAAQAAEARWQKGAPLGALDGVPVTVKDNLETRGIPTYWGTAAHIPAPADTDAPPVARLREAGAIVIAKTTMPDLGMLSSSLSSVHPLTRNPWDLAKTPGGSSGGAAAAAAAGYAPLHLGTDIGGSLRLPAAWCGIFALKPTNGRVPIDPPYIGRVAGPMTRTVADAALAMIVLTQPDERDYMCLPFQAIDWLQLDGMPKGLRLGLLIEAGCGLAVDPEIAAAVESAAKLFEQHGAVIEPVKPFMTNTMLHGIDDFWRARALADLTKMRQEQRAKALPFIRKWAEAADRFDGARIFAGFSQILIMRAAAHSALKPFDFLLTPTAPIAAFDAPLPCPTNDVARPFEHIGFTVAFNMSEQPAASINCGYTRDGLPIGLQIIGKRFDDLGVLRLASSFERIRPPQKPWPEPALAAANAQGSMHDRGNPSS